MVGGGGRLGKLGAEAAPQRMALLGDVALCAQYASRTNTPIVVAVGGIEGRANDAPSRARKKAEGEGWGVRSWREGGSKLRKREHGLVEKKPLGIKNYERFFALVVMVSPTREVWVCGAGHVETERRERDKGITPAPVFMFARLSGPLFVQDGRIGRHP